MREQEKANRPAGNKIKAILDSHSRAFGGNLGSHPGAMGNVMAVVLGLVVVFQQRKDLIQSRLRRKALLSP